MYQRYRSCVVSVTPSHIDRTLYHCGGNFLFVSLLVLEIIKDMYILIINLILYLSKCTMSVVKLHIFKYVGKIFNVSKQNLV